MIWDNKQKLAFTINVNLPHQHTKRSQWSDKNRWGKGICCEVGNFTNNHWKKNAVFILRKEKKSHVLTKSSFCYNSSCTSCWIGMWLDNLSSDWLKCKQHSSKMAVVKLYQSVHNGQYMCIRKSQMRTQRGNNEMNEERPIILFYDLVQIGLCFSKFF